MSSSINSTHLEQLSKLFRSTDAEIIVSDLNRFVAKGDITAFESELSDLGVENENDSGELKLKLKSFIGVVPAVFRTWNFFEARHITEDFVILDTNGDYCYFDLESGDLHFAENVAESFRIECSNVLAYYRLYNFLKSDEFADHHNSVNNEIVLYSSVNGIFKIKYAKAPQFSDNTDYSTDIDLLLIKSKPIQLHQFFKNAFFAFSIDTITIEVETIIKNAKPICDLAIRNFDIVSKQFNFDAFRDSLHKEKEKYFTNIREVVNKIFAQAAGVPISIGATVFATYKVDGDIFFLVLILITFIVYVCYYVRIQLFYKKEVEELKDDFIRDFDIIKSKSGLDEGSIEIERVKILNKIISAKSIIKTLITMIVILGVLALVYITYQLFKVKFTLTGLIHLLIFIAV